MTPAWSFATLVVAMCAAWSLLCILPHIPAIQPLIEMPWDGEGSDE